MQTNTPTIVPTHSSTTSGESSLVERTSSALRDAGALLLQRFSRGAPGLNALDQVVQATKENDHAVLSILRENLQAIAPEAVWVDEELDTGLLPQGSFWIVDPVEGNINHVHGLEDWAITATLVRDNEPVLAVIYLPLQNELYTAERGRGAFQDGQRLAVSSKGALNAAFVGTGQAKPGEDPLTFRRIGESVMVMLQAALVVRVSVPATLQLIHVAAGRMDAFFQFSRVRSGLVSGALLVREAGGVTSDTSGTPWTLSSRDFLATGPALHGAAVQLLGPIGGASFGGGGG